MHTLTLCVIIPLHLHFSQTTFIHGAVILTRVTDVDVAVATVAAGIDYKTFKEFFIKSISFPIVILNFLLDMRNQWLPPFWCYFIKSFMYQPLNFGKREPFVMFYFTNT